MNGLYPLNPGPGDVVELRATVTFTFQVCNAGQHKSPEELAREFQGSYSLMQDELADTVSRALDLEITVTPVTDEAD